jgi:hypothetical protein
MMRGRLRAIDHGQPAYPPASSEFRERCLPQPGASFKRRAVGCASLPAMSLSCALATMDHNVRPSRYGAVAFPAEPGGGMIPVSALPPAGGSDTRACGGALTLKMAGWAAAGEGLLAARGLDGH